MRNSILTILLLIASNTFMTVAWYGNLRFKDISWLKDIGMFGTVLISWGIAFAEYCLMVPANRIGSSELGGPYSLLQLKMLQEVISIMVFLVFTVLFFKTEEIKINHLIGFVFLIIAVYFFFKK
ncbi:MAG: DMT family protein [Bacteroidia bacterium]